MATITVAAISIKGNMVLDAAEEAGIGAAVGIGVGDNIIVAAGEAVAGIGVEVGIGVGTLNGAVDVGAIDGTAVGASVGSGVSGVVVGTGDVKEGFAVIESVIVGSGSGVCNAPPVPLGEGTGTEGEG